jgi:selenide,water dikinase
LAQQGYATGAAERNWSSYGAEVNLPRDFPEWQRKLLCDPQTSGGLLVACAPSAVAEVLAAFHADGFAAACVIGQMEEGAARVSVLGKA